MKGRKRNKAFSLILVLALLAGMLQPSGIGAVQAEENLLAGTELLAHYEFQDGGKDSSGKNNDAVIGNGVTVENGVASLPGGAADGSAYITLPEGMFDKQDTLTVSMWLRDNDPQESWLAAFFFGSPADSKGNPTNYYYFVPCEKQHNTLKLVMTDSVNQDSPWSAEKGFRESTNTVGNQGVWTHYAIVIQPRSMTCYIDGELIGTQSVSRSVSDFGTGLQSYIGKSNYKNDPLYQGDFRDFRVYKNALDQEQVKQVMGSQDNMQQYSMAIDGNNVTKKLSDTLYGLFYEDINSAADGGLYPEMVKNYSFENAYVQKGGDNDYFRQNGYETIGNYKLHWTASPASSFEVKPDGAQGTADSLHEKNPHYAVLKGNVSLENGGFAPQNNPNGAAMAVKPFDAGSREGEYTFSVYAKADPGYSGRMYVRLVDQSGKDLTDEQEVTFQPDGSWQKVSAELTSIATRNTKGKLILTIENAGAADRLCLDMVSVVPHDSFGYGDPNYACGVGIRQDLLELMMGLNPKFMRFPGGCIVEGFNWEGLYDWRDTVGPLEERRSNTNRWENWGNQNRTWGYMQSFGFGYHELLSLCEEYGMEPFPIMSAGVLCQYETKDVNAKTGSDLQFFIDMATDLLDYCWGDAATNEWAKKRAENGHPAPFNLKYIGIGNENLQAKYFNNFDVIKRAVEEYASTHYPDHELNIISSAGPTSTGNDLEYAYDRIAQTMPGETLVDEHYYESESFMYNQADRYDYYERTDQGGSDVFVGEYAIRNNNKYNTALAEACYITGLERNADVVKNISYAPLLYKVGSTSWDHDLIYFDEFQTAKSTNYYVQQMFSNNYGTDLIGTELVSPDKDYSNYGSPIIGSVSAAGSIDKITVYAEDGSILLEDDFNNDSNPNGWQPFDQSSGCAIKDGRLEFTNTNGLNAVYLPKAVKEKWKNFRIEVEGAVKSSGNGAIVIGAGHEKQYYWYRMGQDNAGVRMEVTRPERNRTSLTTKVLGNNYANKHYETGKLTRIQTNDPMRVSFNFGVNGKLEGSYTSANVSASDTEKYDFSSALNQYQTDIYQVVNKDSQNVYIKLVNPDKRKKEIRLDFSNLSLDGKAEVTSLTGGLDDANAIGNEKVAPVTASQAIEGNQMVYELMGYSVNIIRVPLSQKKPPEVSKDDLKKLVDSMANLKASDYTAESWAKFQKELNNAKNLIANADPYQELKDAYNKLKAAKDSLVVKKPTPVPTKPKPTSVKLNVGKKITIGQTEKATFKATIKPSAASKKVTWKSSKPSIVSIKNGKIQGKKTGKSVISVKTSNGKSAKCTVTVKKKPSKITLNKKSKTLKKNKTFKIKVKFPKNTYSYKLTYSTSKKSVATVSSKGVVKAKKKGKAVITVKTFNGKKAKLSIKVR
ncbi:alpha-L-arabinofuranosidase C-terminal domain-containing protein [Lachnospiraceae bacterium 29-84]